LLFSIKGAIGGEISETTIANYYKVTKLFCERQQRILRVCYRLIIMLS